MTTYTIHVNATGNPTPLRHCDYSAVFDGYDGGMIDHETPSNDPIGMGKTPYDAILDLIENALDKGLTK